MLGCKARSVMRASRRRRRVRAGSRRGVSRPSEENFSATPSQARCTCLGGGGVTEQSFNQPPGPGYRACPCCCRPLPRPAGPGLAALEPVIDIMARPGQPVFRPFGMTTAGRALVLRMVRPCAGRNVCRENAWRQGAQGRRSSASSYRGPWFSALRQGRPVGFLNNVRRSTGREPYGSSGARKSGCCRGRAGPRSWRVIAKRNHGHTGKQSAPGHAFTGAQMHGQAARGNGLADLHFRLK